MPHNPHPQGADLSATNAQPHWRTLFAIHARSIFSKAIKILGLNMALSLLFALKGGLNLSSFIQNCALTSVFIVGLAGITVLLMKSDGSMTFMATLPIRAKDHAKAFAIVSLLCSFPVSLFTVLALSQTQISLSLVVLAEAFVSLIAVATAASMFVVASQLRTQLGKIGVFTYAMIFFFVFTPSLPYLIKLGWVQHFLSLPISTITTSLLLLTWAIAGIAFAWAWKSIGQSMAFVPIKRVES